MFDTLWQLIQRGGAVMWPLLGLSVLAMTLIIERGWFWLSNNHPWRLARFRAVGRLLRQGRSEDARPLIDDDSSVYGRFVSQVFHEGLVTEAALTDAIRHQQVRVERFMPTLSTIITAAPLLGILGTVFGIIASFQVLSQDSSVTDPRAVGQGIAEALLTTAAGLTVAIMVLFPYNAYRAQIDKTINRLEALAVACTGLADLRPSPKSTDEKDAPQGQADR